MKLRMKKCQCGCGVKFIPQRSFQVWATPDCAIKIAIERVEKQKRKKERQQKEDARPLQYYKKIAQDAVNAYIRARDEDEPCISCGRWHDGQWHAGHFNSVGSHPELRYHEDNINKQCSVCNAHKGGNRAGYEPRLVAKIGQSRVDWLNGPHEAAHFTREDLIEITNKYRKMLKDMKNVRG